MQNSIRQYIEKMPDGKYHWQFLAYCDKCDDVINVNAMLSYDDDPKAINIGDKLGICEKCGGTLLHGVSKAVQNAKGREGLGINLGDRIRDPDSPRFWKNGKSVGQVAEILYNKEKDPY